MSTALLDAVVKKNRVRLIPFMLALYVLAFLDRSNIGFAKQTYQIDTGLSNEAYALGAGIFFVVYAFLGVPAKSLKARPICCLMNSGVSVFLALITRKIFVCGPGWWSFPVMR